MASTAMLLLILSAQHISALKPLHDSITFECTNRYELRHSLQDLVPQMKNCTLVRQVYPACAKDIVVAYSENSPYSVHSNGHVHGLIPGMLRLVMHTCCNNCTKVKFVGPFKKLEKFFIPNITMALPIEASITSKKVSGIDYVPFLKVQGVSILANPAKGTGSKELLRHLLGSIMSTWPLFVVAFLMAIAAGCVVWILEAWINPNEFPLTFPKGPFEGFWWAFISMTTVGYGDRAPKSVGGRLFAMIWILVGITMFSMYTATLTSALYSSIANKYLAPVYGKKIGVLESTAAGLSAAIQAKAYIVTFADVDSMIKALKENKIYGIALDDTIAFQLMDKFKKEIPDMTQQHHVVSNGNSYGILSYNENVTRFLRSFFESNEDNRLSMEAYVALSHKLQIKRKGKDDAPKSVFASDSNIFIGTVITLFVLGIVTVAACLVCRWFYKNHPSCFKRLFNPCTKCRGKLGSNSDGTEKTLMVEDTIMTNTKKSDIKLSDELLQELDNLKARWIQKIREIDINK